MHGRTVRGQSQPGYLDQIIAVYRDSVVPAARQQPGFHAAYLLTDRGSGAFLSLTMWVDEAALQASERSGYLRAQLGKIRKYLTDDPVVETYTLGIEGDPAAARGRPLYARVTTGQFRPPERSGGRPAVHQQPDYYGLLELANPSTGGALVVMLYGAEEQARAAGASSDVPRLGAQPGQVAHDVYEVSILAPPGS
jgi:quinol monooxygenase YgiN